MKDILLKRLQEGNGIYVKLPNTMVNPKPIHWFYMESDGNKTYYLKHRELVIVRVSYNPIIDSWEIFIFENKMGELRGNVTEDKLKSDTIKTLAMMGRFIHNFLYDTEFK